MKKLYFLILVLGAFLIGCKSKDSVTEAVNETPTNTVTKKLSATYSEDGTKKSIFVGNVESDYAGNFKLTYTEGTTSSSITVTPDMIKMDTDTVGEKVATITYNNLTTTVSALVCTTTSAFDVSGNTITKYKGTDETVVVPKYIGGEAITTLGNGAFLNNIYIKSVIANSIITLQDGIDSPLGQEGVFYRCKKLESLTLAKVEYIGARSTRLCSNLLSVYVPEATFIGESAFYVASKLTSISIPKVISIGDWAFGNTALTDISIPKVTSIGNWAFAYTPLTDISILNETSIGQSAFSYCTSLTTVTFTTINPPNLGMYVFANRGLDKNWNITVPESSRQLYIDKFDADTTTFKDTKPPTINGMPM